MKFHSVSVENLNSLYGRHTIDFERDVRNAPLFLIIGQTGAGKSTLLDGVSLALFGVTPRLEQQRGDSATDVGHIMSIGTATCSAELQFSVRNADGTRERYLAKWSCRRAHEDPDGTIQRPERELSRWEDDGWKLLVSDSRNKEFEGPFRDALRGLTVEDFRRTILLAQGDFSALLHASDDDKAAILERLTSTEIYQEIGARAAKRRRQSERSYMSLKGELEQTEVLEPDERDVLEQQIALVDQMVADAERVLATMDAELTLARTWQEKTENVEQAADRVADAKAAFAELKPELERLDLDKKYRHLEDPYRALVQAEDARKSASKTAKDAEEAVGEIADSLADAMSRRDEAKERVEEIREKWEALDPRLEKAAQIEALLKPARKELEDAEEALESARSAREENQKKLAASRESYRESAQTLQALENQAAKSPNVEVDKLRAQLDVLVGSSMQTAWEHLESFDAESEDSDSVNLTVLRSRRTRAKNLLEEVAPRFEEDGRLDDLASGLSTDIARLREQRDALTEATYAMSTLQQREEEKAAASEKIEQLQRQIEGRKRERDNAAKLVDERKGRVVDLREALGLAEQVISLSELRDALEDGEPCPLCGSPLHPYCMSDETGDVEARTRRDDLKGRLEVAEESAQSAEEDLRRVEAALTGKRAALQHQEGLRMEVVEKLEKVKKTFTTAAEKGGFPPLEVWKLRQGTVLDTALAEAATELDEKQKRAELLRQRRLDWERAVEELRAAERNQADAETRARLIGEAQQQWSQLVVKLRALVQPLGVSVDEEPDWESVEASQAESLDVLTSIEGRREQLAEARKALEAKEKAVERLVEESKRRTAASAEASEARETRKKEVARLQEELREVLPEGAPDDLRKARREQTRAASEALEKAREKAESIKSKHDQLAGRLRERQKQLIEADEVLQEARERWGRLTVEHGVERETVAEALLEPVNRSKLEQTVKDARQAQDKATGALEAARKAREQFLKANDEPTRAVEAIDAERGQYSAWRDAFSQQRGALRERKAQDDRRRASVADRQEELQRLKGEYTRWRTIAQLIGTGDGAAFRTFAQSLNLQGLVDRANVRLAHLAPRYELAVARGDQGQPTLNFSVRDAFRAGHERPLTTLSGGETFLVSLALALALSDYRRIELPVETLLLDEGFGTLDQDALHMAVDTLQRLHQDSTRQVGIISHVEALKEMIDARIVVEKKGNGRSHLRFEVSGRTTDDSAGEMGQGDAAADAS